MIIKPPPFCRTSDNIYDDMEGVEKRDADNVSSIERRKPNQVRAKQEVRSSPWVKKEKW
jgi:hypothetical protein